MGDAERIDAIAEAVREEIRIPVRLTDPSTISGGEATITFSPRETEVFVALLKHADSPATAAVLGNGTIKRFSQHANMVFDGLRTATGCSKPIIVSSEGYQLNPILQFELAEEAPSVVESLEEVHDTAPPQPEPEPFSELAALVSAADISPYIHLSAAERKMLEFLVEHAGEFVASGLIKQSIEAEGGDLGSVFSQLTKKLHEDVVWRDIFSDNGAATKGRKYRVDPDALLEAKIKAARRLDLKVSPTKPKQGIPPPPEVSMEKGILLSVQRGSKALRITKVADQYSVHANTHTNHLGDNARDAIAILAEAPGPISMGALLKKINARENREPLDMPTLVLNVAAIRYALRELGMSDLLLELSAGEEQLVGLRRQRLSEVKRNQLLAGKEG